MGVLPEEAENLSIVDSDLYCYASGVLLRAHRIHDRICGFEADTLWTPLGEQVEYVTRHPRTGDIYFTSRDKKDRSFLFRCDAKRHVHRVKMGGGFLFNKGMTVEHPVFTTDGNIMIFTSRDGFGFGGYDLWYSVFDGKRWGKPRNLGNRINSSADEISPSLYRDCLLFSSNGLSDADGNVTIYSSRLISGRTSGDTVGTLQIGRCKVQKLPVPLNADDADDYDMVFDTLAGRAYWLSLRSDNPDASRFYSFSGSLDGVLLWGRVTDKYDNPLPGVQVYVRQGDEAVCSTTTDEDGFYRVYLRSGQFYALSFQLDEYFVEYESVNTEKKEGEYLIGEARRDARLDRLPLNTRIYYEDLFGPDACIELSDLGMERLEPLVRYLNDNPSMSVDLILSNDLTHDATFNALLTDQRLLMLRNWFFRHTPPTVKFHLRNACTGAVTCSNASGLSRLTVLINSEL